jgi:hypothetical protein
VGLCDFAVTRVKLPLHGPFPTDVSMFFDWIWELFYLVDMVFILSLYHGLILRCGQTSVDTASDLRGRLDDPEQATLNADKSRNVNARPVF